MCQNHASAEPMLSPWLDLQFSRSNMEFAISQPKIVRLPQNKRQANWLISRPRMGPSGLTLAMTLTLNFQSHIGNLLYVARPKKWSYFPKTKFRHTGLMLGEKSAVAGLSNDKQWEPDTNDSDQGDFRCRRAVDLSSLKMLLLLMINQSLVAKPIHSISRC